MLTRFLAGLVLFGLALVIGPVQASHDYQSGYPFYFGFALGFAGDR